ncbi:hypothetical protein Hanom_Chr00s005164g01728161 [Helianthus anomalus]
MFLNVSVNIFVGSSGEPQQRLIDEIVLEPSVVIDQGTNLLKQSLESYLKRNEEAAAQQALAHGSSSEDDSEATQSESELDPTTLGRGKAQLKKKHEEDSPYVPDQPKKQEKKRKAVQAGVIPRNVREKKAGAEPSKEKGGKSEKHVQNPKEPEV